MNHWDAIIVGAGPAGIAAAMAIQRGGGRALLLDRKLFPRPKACAGMLSPAAVAASPFNLGPTTCGASFQLIWKEHSGHSLWHEKNLLSHRIELDAYLHAQAIAAGVTFRHVAKLIKVHNSPAGIRLSTAHHELLRARVLIGADGANSCVRRLAGLPVISRASFALEVDLCLPADPKKIPALFDYDAVTDGYGWWFPKGASSNLGLAVMHGDISVVASAFSRFIKQYGSEARQQGRVRGAAIGAYGPDTCLGLGNILLCGDAAGLADPVTGEGISFAFRSGQAAAQAVLQATQAGEAHGLYVSLLEGMLSRLHQRLNTRGSAFSYGSA